jgi:hypothetical protein
MNEAPQRWSIEGLLVCHAALDHEVTRVAPWVGRWRPVHRDLEAVERMLCAPPRLWQRALRTVRRIERRVADARDQSLGCKQRARLRYEIRRLIADWDQLRKQFEAFNRAAPLRPFPHSEELAALHARVRTAMWDRIVRPARGPS